MAHTQEIKEGYYIEHNGDCWQSVFPSHEAHKSKLHSTVNDALAYMRDEGVWNMKHPGVTVTLDALSHAVLVNMLNNIARMLETGVDPLQVAEQIRTFIELKQQKEEATHEGSSV